MRRCSPTNNYEDRSDLVVKLFENTIYTLQIQLYCVKSWEDESSDRQDLSLVKTNCNVAHYVNVWIDLNNDGIFDDNKERLLHDDHSNGDYIKRDYTLRIAIPKIDGKNNVGELHRIRVILTRDENNRKPCYNVGYGEARDYTVHILQKSYY
ncbi:unnamed protein product [Rotaria sp. Silwood2]|nr:unnamed protein product [Rotaria sp. Silwood2]CAF4074715.1 unnamed protein product [Rotaria sp. Silwood2]